MMRKVCVVTLGCKVNQYEGNQIAHKYQSSGAEVVQKFCDDADLYIVNACVVTAHAEKKSRNFISRARRTVEKRVAAGFGGNLIACGCGNDRALNEECSKFYALQPRKRAFIKVQDGCDNFCSYCIVPYLRGQSRSREIPDIIAEIKASGKPVILTGIDLSSFPNLDELCKQVNALGLPFELSSVEVRIITREFLKVLSDCKNFISKFHVPLQSGSDKILNDMNRKYTSGQYRAAIELVREYFPNAIISTDVIVGFPTETTEDLTQTEKLVAEIGFTKVHRFPYSDRSELQKIHLC